MQQQASLAFLNLIGVHFMYPFMYTATSFITPIMYLTWISEAYVHTSNLPVVMGSKHMYKFKY